jgi:hypothetical protein
MHFSYDNRSGKLRVSGQIKFKEILFDSIHFINHMLLHKGDSARIYASYTHGSIVG